MGNKVSNNSREDKGDEKQLIIIYFKMGSKLMPMLICTSERLLCHVTHVPAGLPLCVSKAKLVPSSKAHWLKRNFAACFLSPKV